MNVLLYVPTYNDEKGSAAMRQETRESIRALQYGEHEVAVEISVDEKGDRRHNIYAQYQRAWKMAKDGGYDALFIVEHDMIVAPDALVKLAACEADIAYGVYLFRESGYLNAMHASDDVTLDRSLDFHLEERAQAFASGGPWPVSGAGFGCTLIRRSVFENVTLRTPRGGHFPDMPLARDVYKAGLRQVAHFGVLCGHVRPDGFVLWPTAAVRGPEPYTLPCRAKTSFTAVWDGRRYFIGQGTQREIPAQTATKLAQLGLVELLA